MTDSPTHHALREVRRTFTSHIAQVILLAVVVLLGISGPFGTLDSMSFGPRLAYWAVTVPATFGLGLFVSAWMTQRLRALQPVWLTRVIGASVTAVTIGIFVGLLNWLAFSISPAEMGYFGPLMASVVVTAIVISLILQYLFDQRSLAFVEADKQPALLDRLDLEKRGALISLSVQDHYVEVFTDKGASLLLMRLSDAIRETGPTDGLQVHRSHWVALGQITSARRQGDKAILTLSDGRELPASRRNIAALKDAGILPR